MQVVNKLHQMIWEKALPFQDKRDDKGHAECVTENAERLANLLGLETSVIIPAAILHDIGWSVMPREDQMLIFDVKATPEEVRRVRLIHQEEGVKLARKILDEVGYPEEKTEKILEIISQHDTREGFISEEEGIMRDADRLWRYSKLGFELDLKRTGRAPEFYFQKREAEIGKTNCFYSEEAKEIARNELAKRKEEYSK